MGIMIYRDRKSAGAAAATMIAAKIIEKPSSVIGLCASAAAIPVYEQLISLTSTGVLDWSETVTFHTSELMSKGGGGGAQARFLEKNLYRNVKMSASRIFSPSFEARDIEAACNNYEERLLEYGGMDLLLLSLGRNGHIAFNGPSREFSAITHVELLPQSTIDEYSNMGETVPSQAVTMGMATLMSAKQIILIASGKELSGVVSRMLSNSITPAVPASMLQLHPSVTYLLDEDAALELS